mgnify:CR=1 FL=1
MEKQVRPVPANLNTVWHRGGKSFVEVFWRKTDAQGRRTGHMHQECWREALPGQQLESAWFLASLVLAIDFAQRKPDLYVQWTWFDQESKVPENALNAPYIFQDGHLVKKPI